MSIPGMGRIARLLPAIVAGWLVIAALPAHAQADDDFWRDDRFSLTVAVFKPEIDTTIKVDSDSLGAGTEIDVEQDLALEDRKSLVLGEGYWRFTRRQSVVFGYFELDRDGALMIDRELQWGDTLYPVNATVRSDFDTDIYWLSYRFSFLHNEKQELAASAGFHLADISARIAGENVGIEENDLLAPMPLIGLSYTYSFNPDWSLHLSTEWFGLEVDDIKGEILNLAAAVDWYPFERVGLSLAYTMFDVRIESGDSDLSGRFEYQYEGPSLGVTLRF